jgi:hypothetical protein
MGTMFLKIPESIQERDKVPLCGKIFKMRAKTRQTQKLLSTMQRTS